MAPDTDDLGWPEAALVALFTLLYAACGALYLLERT